MSVTAPSINFGMPIVDDLYIAVNPSGTAIIVNPGDYMIASGNYWIPTAIGNAAAVSSGLGIALTRNPAYDWAGRQVINSGVIVNTHGVHRVTAGFSGQPKVGVLAYPNATGSGVNAPSGVTGVGATWQTAAPSQISANPTGVPNLGVAQVVAWYGDQAVAGTGQMDVRLFASNARYF